MEPFKPYWINTKELMETQKINNVIRENSTAFDEQVGGDHYKNLAIGPTEYSQKNKLGCCESAVIKYVTRHKFKNGIEDIKKAIHFLEMLLELEYR